MRFLRDGSVMVMGIVSIEDPARSRTKTSCVERMEQAASIVGGDIDRLAISPQCGFASVMVGNDIDEDIQWRKLELVGRTSRTGSGAKAAGGERTASDPGEDGCGRVMAQTGPGAMRRARATCSHNASWSRSVRACTSGRDFGSPWARIGSPNDTPTFGRERSLHPQARLPPASLRSPEADRDHGAFREQRDPRRALLHGEQLVAGPDGAFRGDARQPAVLHHVGHLLERAPHARTAADRHLS